MYSWSYVEVIVHVFVCCFVHVARCNYERHKLHVTFRRDVTLTIQLYTPLYIIWRYFSGRTLYDVQKRTQEFDRERPFWGLLCGSNTRTIHQTGFQIWTISCPWQPVRGQSTGRTLERHDGRSPSWGQF